MEDAIVRSEHFSELELVFPPGVGVVEADPVCNGSTNMTMDDNITGAPLPPGPPQGPRHSHVVGS